jgi:subtilisin family serine protease
VAKVQAGGGVAAVVYNNAASDPTCGVYSGTLGSQPTTTIAAVTLSCADGASAVAAAGSSGTVQSVFSVPDSGYEAWDGTSMATPHVSAVAALIWSCHPTKTNQQIRNALTSTARDKGAAGRDASYGFGIVQAKNALLTGLGGPGSCAVQ